MTKKRLLLIGGGHAHMATLANLHTFTEKGYQVTVVQPSEYQYYSGMGAGMLGWTYQAAEARFATRKIVEKQRGIFIKDKVASIDPEKRTVRLEESGEEMGYDVLSCNAGSFVPQNPVVSDSPEIFPVKPIEGLLEARKKILYLSSRKSMKIAIAGGGPSAVEIAGNVQQLGRLRAAHKPVIQIFAGGKIMSNLPSRVSRLAKDILSTRGIGIEEDVYVKEVRPGQMVLDDGRIYEADVTFLALGVKPSRIIKNSGLPAGPDGGLLVNQYLQCSAYPNIFGGGDCIYFEPEPLDKVGVHAVRQNPILYQNLMASLEGGELKPFIPKGKYLLIYNLGNKTGIFYRDNLIFSGKLAFYIKDNIDRRFVRKFQAIE